MLLERYYVVKSVTTEKVYINDRIVRADCNGIGFDSKCKNQPLLQAYVA